MLAQATREIAGNPRIQRAVCAAQEVNAPHVAINHELWLSAARQD
jgi:hypothetical protein